MLITHRKCMAAPFFDDPPKPPSCSQKRLIYEFEKTLVIGLGAGRVNDSPCLSFYERVQETEGGILG